MSKKNRLKCPYCGEKIGFIKAFQAKTNDEYFCPNCDNFSKVKINSGLRSLAMILAILVGLVLVIFSLFVKFYICGTALVLSLFFAFYLQVPRFIILKKKN